MDQEKAAETKDLPRRPFPAVPTTKILAGYASTVSGWQDRPMVDSPGSASARLPPERDVGRRGARPDGRAALGPSGAHEARVH